MNKKLIAVPLALVLLGGAYTGWYFYEGQNSSSDGRIEGSGTIEAIEFNIGSQLASEVVEVKVEEGEKIEKGDTLVMLDDRILKDQVRAAEAGVDAAKASIEDADTNTEKKMAEAQLRQAEANLSIVKIQHDNAVVKSPVDGVVLSLPVSEGEAVNPGSTLAAIGKVSELELTTYIDEKELGAVKIGQQASISVGAFPDKKFKGNVVEIASEAEFTPQNVQTKEQRSSLVFGIKIRLNNPDGLLKPGMPADVELVRSRDGGPASAVRAKTKSGTVGQGN